MNLDRIGNITSELSSSLVKSIVLPGGLWAWLKRPLAVRGRERRLSGNVVAPEFASNVAEIGLNPLVLLGGCPVPDAAVVEVIRFVGGRAARLAVISLGCGEEASLCAADGLRLFTRYGMKNAQLIEISNRQQAEDENLAKRIAEADGAFLCGEEAAVAISLLQKTRLSEALRGLAAAGKLLAGLDAGAAVLGERLMGTVNGSHEVMEGLGLAPGLILDTDLASHARFGRLLKAMNAGTGGLRLGVGLDAGAAVVVRNGEARVLGETTVTFFDPRESALEPEYPATVPASACELKVHVLMEGYGMNLRNRRPFGPAQQTPQAANER